MPRSVAATDLSEPQVDINDRENASELAPAPEMRVAKWTRRPTSRKASRSQKQRHSATAGSKQDLVLTLLRRQSGVIRRYRVQDALAAAFGPRLPGAIVRKKLKLRLVSEVGKDGVRRYHVAPLKAAKPRT
jgi:hypothetical protein